MPPFVAISAQTFLDSIGVNTDLGDSSTTYANTSLVESELTYVGVENVRDTMAASTDGALYQSVAAATGVKFDIFLSESAFSVDSQIAEMAENTNIIKDFEGENEADTWPIAYDGLTGFAAILATQQALWTMATNTAGAAGIGVIAPSYGLQSSFGASPNMSALSTFANTHEYWGTGNPPGGTIAGMVALAQEVSNHPDIATEAGYYTGPSLDGSGPYAASGVDELVQAKYDLTVLFDDWRNGIQNTYLFDLMDLHADPNNQTYTDHYGLFNADGTPKTAANALHNLYTILGGAGSGAPSGGTFGYQLIGMPVTGNSLLMESASGGYDIALWNDVRLWNPTTGTEIINAAVPVNINFGQIVATVTEYDPIAGTTAIQTWSNVSSISLGLLDHAVILSITPEAQTGSLTLDSFILPETVGATQSSGNLWSTIIANAQDSNAGARLTISSVGTAGTSGTVTLYAATDTLSYQAPSYNPFQPTDSFTYTLDDGQGGEITGTVAITETPPPYTIYGTIANDSLTAPASGWTLDSFSTGETLTDCTSGGDTLSAGVNGYVFINGNNDVVTAGDGTHTLDAHGSNASIVLGNGNNVIGLSGSGYSIKTGNGNNLVWKSLGSTSITMGNGNQAITVGGIHNTISIGQGTSVINAGNDGNAAGYETVKVAGGSNTVNVGGANDSVSIGGGTSIVNASGGAASIAIASGMSRIDAQGGSNVIALAASSSSVTLTGNGNVVTSVSGNDLINSSGNDDRYSLGSGNNTLSAHGSADSITLGNGNNTIGLSGSGYTITAGNGNNVVWKPLGSTRITMGNGNENITVSGTNNVITIGTGTSTINAGTDGLAAGAEKVKVGGGTNTINVGGTNDFVTAISGTNAIVANGSAATIIVDAGTNDIVAGHGAGTITAFGGANVVAVAGNGNDVTGGTGSDSVWVGGNSNIVVAGSGTESITLVGQDDVVDLTHGIDTLVEQGGKNTIALAAAPAFAAQISGNVIAQGDFFDLRNALDLTSWNGSLSTLQNYLKVTNSGSQSMIAIASTGTGSGTAIAVLRNVAGLTYQALLQQAILPDQDTRQASFVQHSLTMNQAESFVDFALTSLTNHEIAVLEGLRVEDRSYDLPDTWRASASTDAISWLNHGSTAFANDTLAWHDIMR